MNTEKKDLKNEKKKNTHMLGIEISSLINALFFLVTSILGYSIQFITTKIYCSK
jgi:hypothetical protein